MATETSFRPVWHRDAGTMDHLPDERLMRLVGQGNHRAFHLLIDRHTRRAVTLAIRMAITHAEAEELVQEAFLRVWVNAPRWKPDGALFRTWFMRILTNLCIDLKRRPALLVLPENDERPDDAPGALTQTIIREDAALVAQAVAALPPRQRAALALCYWDDMSNIEAADVLNLSIGAVESLLVRARRSLRDRLAEPFGFTRKEKQ